VSGWECAEGVEEDEDEETLSEGKEAGNEWTASGSESKGIVACDWDEESMEDGMTEGEVVEDKDSEVEYDENDEENDEKDDEAEAKDEEGVDDDVTIIEGHEGGDSNKRLDAGMLADEDEL
jgi:hypothetical protein